MTSDDAFWLIHEGLPRQGTGSDDTTKKLLDIANSKGNLREAIDMGCGPGRAVLLLAASGIEVTAIDTHQPFLEELRNNAHTKGLESKIKIENISMNKIPYPDASFDLVWSEGTAYIIGWQMVLTQWKRLLKPRGKLVVTDCFWLTDDRSPDAVKFWEADPLMMTVEKAKGVAKDSGYSVESTYMQPESDWFDEYYYPLEQKVKKLKGSSDPYLQEVLAMTTFEIDVRRKYGNEYGHVAFILSID